MFIVHSITKGIESGNKNTLLNLSQKVSRKPPEKIQQLVEKTIQKLGVKLNEPASQTLFASFITDLCPIENQTLLIDLFNKQVLSDKSIKGAFISAIKENKGERALKLAMANPHLILEYVDEKKNAYEFFNEKALSLILATGAINDEFLMRHFLKNG